MTHVIVGISGGIEFCNVLRVVGSFQFNPEKHAGKEVDREKCDECKPEYLKHCRSQVNYSNVFHGPENQNQNVPY